MPPADERFPPTLRLRERADFKRVERRGRRRTGPSLIVVAQRNGLDTSRIGLTVTRKVGNAAARNRWKRRLREIFRRNKDRFPTGWDFVVIVKRSAPNDASFDELRTELLTLMNEASA